MILIMRSDATRGDVERVSQTLERMGASDYVVDGQARKLIEVFSNNGNLDRNKLAELPMVERVLDKGRPVLAGGRGPEDRTFEIPLGAASSVGGRKLCIIAGPCSVESQERLLETARAVAKAGASALRGGAFKPRTSPYSFQGHEERGLQMLARAREETGLAVVSEVMCCKHVDVAVDYVDVFQVGSRNMHNTPLLRAVGETNKPVLLKRGWSATLEEFLLAAEYIMSAGNSQVILCERGIRTHEEYVRNTLALGVVPEIKRVSQLPILVDPSHGTGKAHLVPAMSKAAVACGADGLLIEVHVDPAHAWSDGAQTLDAGQFTALMNELPALAQVCGREI